MLQFINHEIIVKTKVLLPQVYVILADVVCSVWTVLVVLLPMTFESFHFQIF